MILNPYYFLLYDGTRKLTRLFMIEITIDESATPQKLILTCGRIQMVSPTIAMFKIRVKSPMERMINGRDSTVASGLTMELTSEKTRPATT